VRLVLDTPSVHYAPIPHQPGVSDRRPKVAAASQWLGSLFRRVLPPRVNEVVGVSHIKAYVFDDDVLMSGANLSSDYFTIRQVIHRELFHPPFQKPCLTNLE